MMCSQIKVFLRVTWILVYLHTGLHHIYVLNTGFLRNSSLFVFQQCQVIVAREVHEDNLVFSHSLCWVCGKHNWAVWIRSCQESDSASFGRCVWAVFALCCAQTNRLHVPGCCVMQLWKNSLLMSLEATAHVFGTTRGWCKFLFGIKVNKRKVLHVSLLHNEIPLLLSVIR